MTRIEPAEYTPDTAVPPGLTISDILQDLELSVAEFAIRAGLSEDEGFALINGNYPIDHTLAEFLSDFLGMPVHVWENLERNYRRVVERLDARVLDQENVEFSRWFPLKDMIDLGWIENLKNPAARAAELLDFLGINSWREYNPTSLYTSRLRRSPHQAFSDYAIVAWLTRGRKVSEDIETAKFDPNKLSGCLNDLRNLTRATPEVFGPAIVSICQACGVAIVLVPAPRRCTASGAAYKVGDKHVVQLSLRHKRNDHFWFSLFHELAHVLLHLNSGTPFVDDFEYDNDPREIDANNFASDQLLPSVDYNAWRTKTPLTRNAILDFAIKMGIAPGVVVGRLQRDKLLGYEQYPDLFQSLEFKT